MAAEAFRVDAEFDVEEFLAEEREKDLLRFTTAGSVDDGKSTLIGRLLYDSRSVYEDQIHAIARSTVNRSGGGLDLSLLTDGLRAEREQGITIDVAYRYFATARRKFIIADTPGHEQYTRNMATGASTADLAIILIDARNGVRPQSRRHAYIASLLGIPQYVIAVNKMDLVDYSEEVFEEIREDFTAVLRKLEAGAAYFVPISALAGDNVVTRSNRMPWFQGPSLLEYLETVEVHRPEQERPFRFAVQRVIRPDHEFRGYAGQIASGSIRPGDTVLTHPSGRRTRVKSIETFDGPLTRAFAPMSVTITLEDEIDISRGDMISSSTRAPSAIRAFEASAVWLNEEPLDPARSYLLKHTSQTVPARVRSIEHRIDLRTLGQEPASTLELNSIGVVRIETTRPIYADVYRDNRTTGAAILIDPATNATVAALMISSVDLDHRTDPVTTNERMSRYGHRSGVIRVGPHEPVALALERRLFDRGALPAIVWSWNPDIEAALRAAGAIAILVDDGEPEIPLPSGVDAAVDRLIAWMEASPLSKGQDEVIGGEGI
jgi:sulfate adenylyltransferase subunit 1